MSLPRVELKGRPVYALDMNKDSFISTKHFTIRLSLGTLLVPFLFLACGANQDSIGSNSLVKDKVITDPSTGKQQHISPISRDYVITADPNKNEIQFFASFRADNENGPSVLLENPSKILFNQEEARPMSISKGSAALMGLFLSPLLWLSSGTSYHLTTHENDFSTIQEVTWIRPDGEESHHTFSIPPCEIESSDERLSFDQPFKVVFSEISKVTQVLGRLTTTSGEYVSQAYLKPEQIKSLQNSREAQFVFTQGPTTKKLGEKTFQLQIECDLDQKLSDQKSLGIRASVKRLARPLVIHFN